MVWNATTDVSKDASASPITSIPPLTSVPINVVNKGRNIFIEPGFRHTAITVLISIISLISPILFNILLAPELRRVRNHLVVEIGIRLLEKEEYY